MNSAKIPVLVPGVSLERYNLFYLLFFLVLIDGFHKVIVTPNFDNK